MKSNLKKVVLFLISVVVASSIMAIPAHKGLKTQRQSTGKTISFYLVGDEFMHCARTTDRYTLLSIENGDMVYAVLDNEGNIVASDVVASNPNERDKQEIDFLSSIDKNLFFSQQQIQEFQSKRNFRNNELKTRRESNNGDFVRNPNLLVVLVNFTNATMQTSNINQFTHQIKDSNYNSGNFTGSVRDYFFDNSFEQMDPNFHVIGPYTLNHPYSFYGSNEDNCSQMVVDALNIADTADDIDLSIFDNDGDGQVDLVHVIYAGQGEHYTGQTSQIWAHMWYVENSPTYDGVQLHRYSCSSELGQYNACDGIGAVCHEMGHVFGLPDFYDSDYDESGGTAATTGEFDVMAEGSYNNNCLTPPYYSMVERNMIGWAVADTITANATYTLEPIIESNNALHLDLDEDEYLTFEYRKKVKWDEYIPAEGMIVFHAVSSKFENWEETNDINVNPNDRGFYIEPAAGGSTNNSTSAVAYPGSSNVTSKSGSSLRDGTNVPYIINDIHYDENNNIVFTYINTRKVIFTLSAQNITTNSAEITGTFSSDYTMTDRTLQWRTYGDSIWANVALNDDSFSIDLNNLTPSTKYEYRLLATAEDTVYNSDTKYFFTLCDGSTVSTLPYIDGFEGGIDCWTVESISGNAGFETVTSLNVYYDNILPIEGEKMLVFSSQGSGYQETSARIISPTFDLTNYNNVKLSYAYNIYSFNQRPLTVYYRLSPESSWVELTHYTSSLYNSNLGTWKRDSILVPEVSDQMQFAFVERESYFYGVVLDDFKIKGDAINSSIVSLNADDISLSLYPNPTTSNTTLKLKGLNEQAEITVIDQAGRVLSTTSLPKGANNYTLYTSDLSSGVYYIRIQTAKTVKTEKLIKK